MLKFTLYTANCTGNSANCLYPNQCVITDKNSFIAAAKQDHVMARFKNDYRSVDNFLHSDNVSLDLDNDHSDDEKDWLTPLDIALAILNVPFVAAYSRNHMKQKGNKSPRPRFHVFFPIEIMRSADEYTALKKRIALFYPYFDSNALDCARFFFGTDDGEVEIYDGDINIVDFLDKDDFAEFDVALEEVQEGNRNSTMSHIAGKLIKRYGNTEDSFSLFLKQANKCNPPLPENELSVIWNSATKFGAKVSSEDGYIPPELYNSNYELKPEDYSDVNQATVFAREYESMIRFSPSTDFLVYNNSFWEESKPKSQGVSQHLTERQLAEAEVEIRKAMEELMQNGGMEILASVGAKKAAQMFNKQQSCSFDKYQAAMEYKKFSIKRRDSKFITATLKEAIPML